MRKAWSQPGTSNIKKIINIFDLYLVMISVSRSPLIKFVNYCKFESDKRSLSRGGCQHITLYEVVDRSSSIEGRR